MSADDDDGSSHGDGKTYICSAGEMDGYNWLCAAPCAQTKPNGLGYAPGWCGVHVTQYQKNEGPNASNGNGGTSDYRLDVEIFDSNQFSIDKVTTQDAPAGQAVNVQGKLPGPLSVTAQNVDSDAVLFSYQGQNWAYADVAHQCNFGQWDSGSRSGDCGFTC